MDEESTERCPECGADYFHAVPGITTQEQIVEFLKSVGGDVSDPCLHPGAYCPAGCSTGYLASYPIDVPREITGQRYDLVLDEPVDNDAQLILYLKRKFGWSLSDGRERIRRGSYPLKVCDGALWQLQDIRDELVGLGVAVTIPNEPKRSTFKEAINDMIDNRYPEG